MRSLQKLANWPKGFWICIEICMSARKKLDQVSWGNLLLAAHCFLGLWECVHVFQGADLVSVIIWWSPRFMCKLPSSSTTKDLQCLYWELAGALPGVPTALTGHGAFFGNRRKPWWQFITSLSRRLMKIHSAVLVLALTFFFSMTHSSNNSTGLCVSHLHKTCTDL